METIIENSDMTRFTQSLTHCRWLLSSIKPLKIFIIDKNDSIFAQWDYGIDHILSPLESKSWSELSTYILQEGTFFIQERAWEDKKVAIAYLGKNESQAVEKALEYLFITFELVPMEEPTNIDKSWQKILSLKDILLHMLYESDYTRNLDRIGKAFLDYICEAFDGKAALFSYEKVLGLYRLNVASNAQVKNLWEKLSFTREELEALVNHQSVVKLDELTPLTDVESHTFLWPLKREDRIYSFLVVTYPKSRIQCMDESILKKVTDVISECSKLLFEIQGYIHARKMGRRYHQLFTVTKKFHSTMDDREVIEEVMNTIAAHYPSYDIFLLFTDEGEERDTQHPAAVQAFLSGEAQFSQTEHHSLLFAPLSGRQGVYGVIEIAAPSVETFSNEDMEFISLLANTAGHAFENAKLYQQSQRSISDLQLINKTSQKLNENLRFNETVDYLLQEIQNNFEADEAGFFLVEQTFKYTVYPGSTNFFQTNEGIDMMDWVIAHIREHQEALFRGNLQSENKANGGFQSLVALPLKQNETILGLVVVLHREAYHFSFDGFRLLQSIVRHSSLALANALLREELEYQVMTDQLTGLYARDYLNKKVDRSIKIDQSGVMILIDIDDFKQINDTHGHVIGDKILIHVAEVMKSNIRQYDIAARWGGEELAIYLPNCDINIGKVIAERLIENVQIQTNPKVTISCGLAHWEAPHFVGDVQELFIPIKLSIGLKKKGKTEHISTKNKKS